MNVKSRRLWSPDQLIMKILRPPKSDHPPLCGAPLNNCLSNSSSNLYCAQLFPICQPTLHFMQNSLQQLGQALIRNPLSSSTNHFPHHSNGHRMYIGWASTEDSVNQRIHRSNTCSGMNPRTDLGVNRVSHFETGHFTLEASSWIFSLR